jgi:F420 biosynthesis protein FbiB-like protein
MKDEAQTLYRLMQERRSIRRYAKRPVDRAVIERLLTAATWAPSAHNRQPWRLVVIDDPAIQERLADAMNAVLRADLAADGLSPDQIEVQAARRRERLTRAPVLILLCMTMADMDKYPDVKRRHAEWTMATQSVALAGQNLLLAAHAEGLGACWLCAPLFCPEVVRATLALPEDWEPQAFISLGWPAERPPAPDRRRLSEQLLTTDRRLPICR